MNDELSKLALKYRTDKWGKHHYTPIYYELFKDRQKSVEKVLEFGVGEGASLRMWRDFFPGATIYGAEIDPKRIFKSKSIKVYKCDQSSKKSLLALIKKTGSNIDFVIDDASHIPQHQVFTCLTLMPLLKRGVIYIIEDVADANILEKLNGYDCKMITVGKRYDDKLIVVRNRAQMNTYKYILKKYNIDPNGQVLVEIPNVGRNNLAELFAELKFTKGAEIGVDRGAFSEILCQANPQLQLFSIDPWKISTYGPDVIPSEIGIVKNQQAFEANYKEAKKRLASYNCTIIQKDSLTAAKDFPNNSLDFVYIDANHDFVNVTNDLDAWKKKIRLGGILAGHDFEHFPPKKWNHVKYVVDVYFRCYEMIPFFILGAKRPKEEGKIRDRVRSWFWVKND